MVNDSEKRQTFVGSPYALELQGVGRTFGALVALHDVSFKVMAGERRAVLGANGAGKTTLFNAVTGDFPPTSGRITFFGEDITVLPPHERIRRGLRRTYQNSLLFHHLSVRDNLYLAQCGATRGRFSFRRPGADDLALEQTEKMARYVHLEGELDLMVSALSHGQQRQLEIGMALAGAPRLLLLDEPAAGLSAAERADLMSLLNGLPPHIGFIIIEHNIDIALKAVERVTIMQNGRIFKEGSPSEIQNDPDVQKIYLGESHREIRT